ncbi:MAG: polysaccharide biosynthesis protein [Clostridia bacterium]
MSRTKYILKNSITGVISKILTITLGFISRTVFIYFLGTEYLGVNGLYTELLSVLSLTELGLGSAMVYALYKPVSDNDDVMISKLMNFYKSAYRYIATIILVLGIIIIPFLPIIVNGADSITLTQLRLYYCIFLFNTVVNYFVSYKYSIVNANQKNYLITNIEMVIHFITSILQIIFLFTFKNFTVYLVTQSTLLLISRIYISLYLNKKFPILTQNVDAKLTREEKAPITKNVQALVVHRFAGAAVYSTDNIIISMFSGLGVAAVGLISNYTMLTSSVLAFVIIILTSVTSSFGNMAANSTTENFKKAFLQMNFIGFWSYGFCVISFIILIPPFITLWIGPEFLIDNISFLLIMINIYIKGQCDVFYNTRASKGEFGRDKWYALLEAIVNLVVSVIFALKFGLPGVYMGTVTARLVYLFTRPSSVYYFLFETSCKEYYKSFAKNSCIVIFAGAITYFATLNIISVVTITNFLIACVIVAIIPNIIFLVFSFKTEEFQGLVSRFKYLNKSLKSN